MMAICCRRQSRATLETSRSSSSTLPLVMSIRSNSASSRELLPEPVRPTTPQVAPDGIVKDSSFRTGGRPGLYRACNSAALSSVKKAEYY